MRNREGEKASIKIIGINVLGNRDLILPELLEKGINISQNFLPGRAGTESFTHEMLSPIV